MRYLFARRTSRYQRTHQSEEKHVPAEANDSGGVLPLSNFFRFDIEIRTEIVEIGVQIERLLRSSATGSPNLSEHALLRRLSSSGLLTMEPTVGRPLSNEVDCWLPRMMLSFNAALSQLPPHTFVGDAVLQAWQATTDWSTGRTYDRVTSNRSTPLVASVQQ